METQKLDPTTPSPAPEAQTDAAAAPAAAPESSEAQKQSQEPGSRTEHIRAALEQLYDKFPKAFLREGDAKPLKVGILDDLKKELPNIPGMTMSKLRAAVRMYCTRLRYLYNMREGVMRIDLEGNEVEPVTAEHGQYAKERFEEINEERKKRKEENNNKDEKGRGGQKRPFVKGGKKPFNKNNKFRKPGFNNNRGSFNNRPRPEGAEGEQRAQQRPTLRVNSAQARVRRAGTGMGTRTFGVKATEADLKVGTSVLVLNNNHYVKGTVSSAPDGGNVKVQLTSGLTLALPVERVLLPGRPAAKSSEQK